MFHPCGYATSYDTLSSGAFIINMGITPQTDQNALRPYGMIYDLVINYQVPIKWVIETGKARDGIDFTHNSVTYRGGTFIIPEEYRTTAVNGRITYWEGRGVVGNTSVSQIVVPVYHTITSFPNTVIDDQSSAVIIPYYQNAEIPSTAYTTGDPGDLDGCNDFFAMPHADPTWAVHNNLYTFITQHSGYFYASCHAVSELESISNPNPPYEQLNFLSTNGLQCWQSGQCFGIGQHHAATPTTPYIYAVNVGDDPIMQFMGDLHLATQNGSEQWFIPLTTGSWNPGAHKLLMTSDGSSGREGIKMMYGYAYDDTSNGMVMYHGGHRLTPPNPGVPNTHKIAGQRSYFNFVLLSTRERAINLELEYQSGYISTLGDTFSVTPTTGMGPYTYQWTANVVGTFSNPTGQGTTFTPDTTVTDSTIVIVTVQVTDFCGRENFATFQMLMVPESFFLPIKTIEAVYKPEGVVEVIWTATAIEGDTYFEVERKDEGPYKRVSSKITSNDFNYLRSCFEFYDPVSGLYGKNLYYRVRETAPNGNISFSSEAVVRVPVSATGEVRLYPNPGSGTFHIELADIGPDMPFWVDIYNATGALVGRKEMNTGYASCCMKMHANEWEASPGMYTIRVMTPNGIYQSAQMVVVR